ncbi:HEAT repeat domain-containing protein [Dactylosporangium darangshiense]|uniref:HEAT repeat domain-containing protein n=1 Tax=Dactylosporangium darangshiense TaxID=579108 RepID=A0ABP8DL34_9ACTN
MPGVLAALDGGVDAWRAVQVAGCLPHAVDRLVPRLAEHLRRADLTGRRDEMSARAALRAMSALGDPSALPMIVETLLAAVRHEAWGITTSALQALTVLGSPGAVAQPVLAAIRPLTAAGTDHFVREAAVPALWSAGGDPREVTPLLYDLLESPIYYHRTTAAELLAEVGERAALPRLRELATSGGEWIEIAGAEAVWRLGGPPEAPLVLERLLRAWAKNGATANDVTDCLDRMGPAAAPALPQLRAELARPRRGGHMDTIENDESLQRTCRKLVERLATV